MVVNKHGKTRRGKCFSETLNAVGHGAPKAVGHGDGWPRPGSFRDEQAGPELNFSLRRNPDNNCPDP